MKIKYTRLWYCRGDSVTIEVISRGFETEEDMVYPETGNAQSKQFLFSQQKYIV